MGHLPLTPTDSYIVLRDKKRSVAVLSAAMLVSVAPFQLTLAGTCDAPSTYLTIGLGAEGVTILAFGLSSVLGRSSPTPLVILLRCHRLNVCGVYAVPNSAQMVAVKMYWNHIHKQLVHESVNTVPRTLKCKCPVFLFSIASPLPTRNAIVEMFGGNFDFGKKTTKKLSSDRRFDKLFGKHLLSPIQKVSVRLGGVLNRTSPSCFYFITKCRLKYGNR